jgi:hypothetical protein
MTKSLYAQVVDTNYIFNDFTKLMRKTSTYSLQFKARDTKQFMFNFVLFCGFFAEHVVTLKISITILCLHFRGKSHTHLTHR